MSAAVNRPTDVKVKEADVNRKLQIYGIISAFQQGKAPSVSTILQYNAKHPLFLMCCALTVRLDRMTKSMLL